MRTPRVPVKPARRRQPQTEVIIVDLRSAQVYCWPALRAGLLCCNFLVSQEVSLNLIPPFLWVKLWVGRGYTEISRYFPASWINWVTLVTKIKLLYSLRFEITFESPKMPLWYDFFCVSKPYSVCSIPFLPQQPCKVFSHWLIVYTRVYRLQHSPNLVDVGLYE